MTYCTAMLLEVGPRGASRARMRWWINWRRIFGGTGSRVKNTISSV